MILGARTLEGIIAHAKRDAPIEACGYLIGTKNRVARHVPMTNTDRSTEHFSLDPKEQFAVVKAARKEGLVLTGIYHSHPASPARLSAEDIRLASDPALVYVIVSLKDSPATVRGFRIKDEAYEDESLDIYEEHV